jgi:hypothetical protein
MTGNAWYENLKERNQLGYLGIDRTKRVEDFEMFLYPFKCYVIMCDFIVMKCV